MRQSGAFIKNERGSVIVIAMIVLVLLTIIGISATNTSTTELQIATNEQLYKIAFYAADGGTRAGAKLLMENIIDRDWNAGDVIGSVAVEHADFYQNNASNTPDPVPSDTNRDAFLPAGAAAGQPHTNLKMCGNAQLSSGTATQLAAGYEGKGKGAAGGGVWVVYDVRAEHRGVRSSRASVTLRYRYVF